MNEPFKAITDGIGVERDATSLAAHKSLEMRLKLLRFAPEEKSIRQRVHWRLRSIFLRPSKIEKCRRDYKEQRTHRTPQEFALVAAQLSFGLPLRKA